MTSEYCSVFIKLYHSSVFICLCLPLHTLLYYSILALSLLYYLPFSSISNTSILLLHSPSWPHKFAALRHRSRCLIMNRSELKFTLPLWCTSCLIISDFINVSEWISATLPVHLLLSARQHLLQWVLCPLRLLKVKVQPLLPAYRTAWWEDLKTVKWQIGFLKSPDEPQRRIGDRRGRAAMRCTQAERCAVRHSVLKFFNSINSKVKSIKTF